MYLGSRVVERLLAAGHHVAVLSRPRPVHDPEDMLTYLQVRVQRSWLLVNFICLLQSCMLVVRHMEGGCLVPDPHDPVVPCCRTSLEPASS